jgi:hypothetical protein
MLTFTRRRSFGMWMLVCVAGCVAAAGFLRAQDQAPPARPAGQRIWFTGNSWSILMPQGLAELVKAAGIEGHEQIPVKPNDLAALEAAKPDVFTNGVHWWMETPWGQAEKVVETGLKANPNFRAYYQAAWLVGDGRAGFPEGRRDPVKVKEDYDATNTADLQAAQDKTRKHVEGIVDTLNEKFGKRVVFLVPVGDAVVKLREMVVAGTFPGVQKQSQLWSDAMPHAGNHVWALSSYCHFAAIYRMSPVGLTMKRFDEVTDDQHAILQKIAWETVSKYPYAGVAP